MKPKKIINILTCTVISTLIITTCFNIIKASNVYAATISIIKQVPSITTPKNVAVGKDLTISWNKISGTSNYKVALVDTTSGYKYINNLAVYGTKYTIPSKYLMGGHTLKFWVGCENSAGVNNGSFILFTVKNTNTAVLNNSSSASIFNLKLSATAYKTENSAIYVTGQNNINPVFAGRLAKLAKDFGVKVNITSGYRTIQEQQDLVIMYVGMPGYYIKNNAVYNSNNEMMVAAPGKSRHNYKFAADCSGFITNLSNAVLNKYGLYKPMSYENWHIEPIETRNI